MTADPRTTWSCSRAARLRPRRRAGLDDDDAYTHVEDEDGPDPLCVGMAMAEVVTGVEITPADLTRLLASGYFGAPALAHPGSE